jgi:hypothetical protein
MTTRHPKTVRRKLLRLLYETYQADPLEMLNPGEIVERSGVTRQELVPNMHYLQDRGLVELMLGYNPPLFAAARITATGIDLVENAFEFNLRFPPDLDELERGSAHVPLLIERLTQEADFAPLDGEVRQALLRDVQYLRDELARRPDRWRRDVIETVLGWMQGHFLDTEERAAEHLPSLGPLREAVRNTPEF